MLSTLLVLFGGIGLIKMYGSRGNPVPNITIAKTTEQIARGEHLVKAFCTVCHGVNGDLPISGGQDAGKDGPIPIGELISYNLTPGGPLKDWSDGEIFRAVREGVDRNGRPLLTMQALSYRNLSDDDIQAVIAFLRSQPAIQQDAGGDNPNLLFAIFAGAGLVPEPKPVTGVVTAPPKGSTPEYGNYIVSYVGCRDCHGASLTGGSGGLTPAGPNLKVVAGWTLDEFVAAMRTGVDPGGHALDPKQMLWEQIGKLDDVELEALYQYLHGLTPIQK